MPSARLADRSTLLVSGADAAHFLQNLVTLDLDALPEGEARPGALLTPQGKILFDFLASRAGEAIRLDVAAEARDALAKRLTLYRLRAQVAIEAGDEAVAARWDEAASGDSYRDARFASGVERLYGEAAGSAGEDAGPEFERLRIRHAVAEAGRDFPAGDAFPHDVLLDQNGGVSFRKGCFVGQEVVSRMQHRGTARRRLMALRGDGVLTPGAEIVAASGRALGTVLAASGEIGMGLLRIDRLADALAEGATVRANGVAVAAQVPSWATYVLPAAGSAADAEA